MSIRVDLTDILKIKKLIHHLTLMPELLPRKVAEEAYQHALDFVPVRTGRLRQSIHIETHGKEYHVVAGSRIAYYAPYVEFGTRPHIILPRRAKVLRFEVRGQVVYARYVHHPGTKPQYFMRRAAERTISELGYIIAEYLELL